MALRLLPPSIDERRAPRPSSASSARLRILMALPRPVWISRPECPPLRPDTVRWPATNPFGAGSNASAHVPVVSRPPEHPTYRAPSSSESRFISVRLTRESPASPPAPVSPVSSSIVNRNSRGPWTRDLSSMMARLVATAMPLSAPRVVPFAIRKLPFRTSSIGSFEKSWTLSLFFSQTMSRWPCRQRLRTFSFPGDALLRTTTLPSLSAFACSPRRLAVSRMYLVIFSSCFEHRGIRAISAKYFHTSGGFRPSIALDIANSLRGWAVGGRRADRLRGFAGRVECQGFLPGQFGGEARHVGAPHLGVPPEPLRHAIGDLAERGRAVALAPDERPERVEVDPEVGLGEERHEPPPREAAGELRDQHRDQLPLPVEGAVPADGPGVEGEGRCAHAGTRHGVVPPGGGAYMAAR